MITMKTGSKAPVRFIFSDLISETTITIQPDDDSAEIAAKLQRVLELEGGYTTVVVNGVRTQPYTEPDFTPADRAAYDQRMKDAAQSVSMGWGESVNIEELPEA